MRNDGGKLLFGIGLDNEELRADVERAKKQFKGIADNVEHEGGRMDSIFKKLGGAIAGAFALSSIKQFGLELIEITGKFQTFEAVLTNTLQNQEKARGAMEMIQKFAATTPFQVDALTGAFVKLANQGFVPTFDEMMKLGDLASSTGKGFDQLAEAIIDAQTGEFERLKEFGIRASKEGDKVTFAFKEQKKEVNFTASAIREYLLSLGDLEGVAGANAKIAETLSGQYSNLQDTITQALNEIGQSSDGILSGTLSGISSIVENYKYVGQVLLEIIGIYGTYKAAVMTLSAVEMARHNVTLMMGSAEKTITAAQAIRIIITNKLKAAQDGLNDSMLKNPHMLAAAGLAAVGFAIYKLATYETEAEKANKRYNDAVKDVTKSVESEKSELSRLRNELNAAEKGSKKYQDTKDIIVAKYGQYFKGLKDEIEKVGLLESRYNSLSEAINNSYGARKFGDFMKSETENYEKVFSENAENIYDKLVDRLGKDDGAKISNKIRTALESGALSIGKSENDIRGLDQETQEALNKAFSGWDSWTYSVESAMANIIKAKNALDASEAKFMSTYGIGKKYKDQQDDEVLAEQRKKEKADEERAAQEEAARIESQAKAVLASQEKATKAAVDLKRKEIKDKKALIDANLIEEIRVINKEREEFKKVNPGASTKSFDERITTVRAEAKFNKEEIDKQLNDLVAGLERENNKLSLDIEIAGLKDQADRTTNLNEKLKIQSEIRKKLIDQQMEEISLAENKELESAQTEDPKQIEKIKSKYRDKRMLVDQQSTNAGEAEDLKVRLTAYEEYAKRLVEIDQWRSDELKKIKEDDNLSKNEKDIAASNVDKMVTFDRDKLASDLGIVPDEVTKSVMDIVDQTINMSIDELMAKLPVIRSELENAKKNGADKEKVATLTAKILIYEKEIVEQRKKSNEGGDVKAFQDKLKNTQTILGGIGDVISVVGDQFGAMFGEAGQDAMSVVMTIKDSMMGVISAVLTTSTTASSAIKSLESASVILAIISAAIAVIMALVNVFSKYFSNAAKIQEQIDKSKDRVKALQNQYKDLELQIKKAVGTDYYSTMNKQIENTRNQVAELDRAIVLAKEKADQAPKGKKKDEANQQVEDLKNQRRDAASSVIDLEQKMLTDIISGDLKGYSEKLADAIVEGFDSGLKDLSFVWDKAFKDLMRDMVTKQISIMLQDNLQKVWKTLDGAVNTNGSIDRNSVERAKQEYLAAESQSKARVEAYRKLMDEMGLLTDESDQKQDQSAEKKGFEAMSQDTGDDLKGIFTAVQISTASIDINVGEIRKINLELVELNKQMAFNTSILVGVAENQLDELRVISSHTVHLSDINRRLKGIEENTSKL